MHIVFDIKG